MTTQQTDKVKYHDLLLHHISDAVIFINTQSEITGWNTAAEKVYGFNEKMKPGHLLTTIPGISGSCLQQAIEDAINTGKHAGLEEYFDPFTGRWLQVDIHPLPDGYFMLTKDISTKKEAELALKTSEEKYRSLFHNSPLPMFVMEMQTYCFLDVNEAVIRHYGYTREELLTMRAQDMRPAEDIDRFYNRVDLPSDGQSRGYFRHCKKNGEIIDVEIFVHDFLYQGRSSRLVLAIDISVKLETQRKLLKTTEQLRALSAHLQDIREEERTNMAREIHDELGQQLTILKMDISWLNRKLADYEDTSLLQRSKESLKMLNDTIKMVRRIATELRPSMLDDLGLLPAIQWQSREFESRADIKVDFESDVPGLCVPPAIATSLFRIYQEALTNIARHAQAKNVLSRLRVENNQLLLLVSDDGCGFDVKILGVKKTLGLLGMKERTLIMGGVFEINSVPGKGTTIQITVPIPSSDTDENIDC